MKRTLLFNGGLKNDKLRATQNCIGNSDVTNKEYTFTGKGKNYSTKKFITLYLAV